METIEAQRLKPDVPWDEMSANEKRAAIGLLSGRSYRDVADELGVSHGWVYDHVALKYGLRRREAQIRKKAELERERNEFLERCLNTTRKADAFDFLKSLPSNSVDLFVSSPPYNINKDYSEHGDGMAFLEYLGSQMMIISEIARCLKPGATVVYQIGTTKDDDGERYPLDEVLAPFFRQAKLKFQDRIVWPAQNGLTPKYHLANRYETALVFSKGQQVTWNPNSIRTPQKYPAKRAFKGANAGQLSGHPLGSYPSDIWNIARVGHNHPERCGHPAQFPIEFPRRAILAYTMPGDVVADIYAGSGSTQIACIRTGRRFIGSDLGYAELRAKRLRGETMDLVTPFTGVTEESLQLRAAEAGATTRWVPDKHRIETDVPPISNKRDLELCLEIFGQAS